MDTFLHHRPRLSLALTCLAGILLALPSRAQQQSTTTPSPKEDFFIISSVDPKKQQIVLKRPTEVTELIAVNDKTVFQDERGRRLQLKDLRAGDTVYVTFGASGSNGRVARRIRKGAMTAEELHRRYLDF